MNLRNVLRTYSLLRQLTDDESALLETLRGLNDAERESLVMALQPEKVMAKKPTTERKIEHCEVCDYTRRAAVHKDSSLSDYHEFQSSKSDKPERKSKRAASLAQKVGSTLASIAKTVGGDDKGARAVIEAIDKAVSDDERCVAQRDDLGGITCGLLSDHNVHQMRSVRGYHPFVSASDAASTGARSSTNGGAGG